MPAFRGRRRGVGSGTFDRWLSGAARRAAIGRPPPATLQMPLTRYKTKGGSQLAGLDQKNLTAE